MTDVLNRRIQLAGLLIAGLLGAGCHDPQAGPGPDEPADAGPSDGELLPEDGPSNGAIDGDGTASSCHPRVREQDPLAISICGRIGSKAVSFTGPADYIERQAGRVRFETANEDGLFVMAWGPDDWQDNEPHALAGCLIRPPGKWLEGGGWLECQSGTITHPDDQTFEATLTSLSIRPACDGSGGTNALQMELAGVPSVGHAGLSCRFSFRDWLRMFTPTCHRPGGTFALDGATLVYSNEPVGTACVGPDASMTWIVDPATGGEHAALNLPSLSARVPVPGPGPVIDGELRLLVRR